MPAALLHPRRRAGLDAAAAAHRPHPCRPPAVGRLAGHHRRSCSASARGSSTSTTRSPWRRRSAPLVGIGAAFLWKQRTSDLEPGARWPPPSWSPAWWAIQLLDRSPTWNPWLHPLIFVDRRPRRGAAAPAAAAAPVGGAAGRWSPRSWPRWSGPSPPAWPRRPRPTPAPSRRRRPAVSARRCGGGGSVAGGGFGAAARWRTRPQRRHPAGGPARRRPVARSPRRRRRRRPARRQHAVGRVVAALEENADQYTWVAATIGANEAAGYQLATDDPVMAIGGFNGTDPSPTLAEFQARWCERRRDPLVHRRRVRGLRRVRWQAHRSRRGWSSTTSRSTSAASRCTTSPPPADADPWHSLPRQRTACRSAHRLSAWQRASRAGGGAALGAARLTRAAPSVRTSRGGQAA